MSYWVFDHIEVDDYLAFDKPKRDVVTFATAIGWQKLPYFITAWSDEPEASIRARLIGVLAATQAGDTVLHQVPSYNGYQYDEIVLDEMTQRGLINVAIVHDLESIRLGEKVLEPELTLLRQFKAIIVHNQRMKAWLEQHQVMVPIIVLDVFDYRSSVPAPTQQFARKLHYAGSLAPEKAPFLQSWSPALNLTVYGNPNQTLRNQQAFAIHPPVHGDILPGIMQDGFGLVWDGDIQPADNEFGRYTRMNNPHKFSLYMAAGLPVIVWSEMAIATVVQRHQLGYVINSLTDLPALLNTVTAASYRKLQANAQAMSMRVRNGFYTQRALLTMMILLEERA